MRRRHSDPAAMTAEDRLYEVAAILALGYIRLRIPRHAATQGTGSGMKTLAGNPESRPSCGSMAQSPENPEEAA